MSQNDKPQPGDTVRLLGLPPGFLDDLPEEDQRAIRAMLGKTVLLSEYDELGRAGLDFTEANGTMRTIYVDLKFIDGPC